MEKISLRVALLLMTGVLLQSFSFLSIKYSTLSAGYLSLVFLLIAFCFMAARALIWQHVLKRTDITRVYPVNALVQVLVFGYAVVLFGEQVHPGNILGLALMLAGVFMLSRPAS